MNDTSQSQIEDTAGVVLEHLQEEERILADMLQSARDVRAGLLSGDLHAQQEAFRERLARPAALHEQRQALRKQIATDLDIPIEDATLRGIADRVPRTFREGLLAAQERVRIRVAEIDRLNRANAVLAAYFIDLIQKLLGDPSSQRPSANRYSSSGELRRDDNPKHSGLQVRC